MRSLPGARASLRPRAFRSSWTARSRSARCRSTRPGSTSTPCPARSGSAGRRGQARSSSPTRTRLRVAGPSYLSQHGYEPDGTFEPKDGAARFDPNLTPNALVAGLAGGDARDARLGARAGSRDGRALPRRGSPSRAATSSFRRSAPHSSPGALRWRSPRPSSSDSRTTGVIVRDLPGRGLDPCVRRLVDERRRSRASAWPPCRVGACASTSTPRHRSRPSPALRSRTTISSLEARGREPVRGVRRDARGARARRRRHPPGRPRPLPLLRGARPALRRARIRRARVRLLRAHGRRREARRRLRVHAARAADDARRAFRRTSARASRTFARAGMRRGLHGRVLLRRPQLVACRRSRVTISPVRSASTVGRARATTAHRGRRSVPQR